MHGQRQSEPDAAQRLGWSNSIASKSTGKSISRPVSDATKSRLTFEATIAIDRLCFSAEHPNVTCVFVDAQVPLPHVLLQG